MKKPAVLLWGVIILGFAGKLVYDSISVNDFKQYFPSSSACNNVAWSSFSIKRGEYSVSMPCTPKLGKVEIKDGAPGYQVSSHIPGERGYGAVFTSMPGIQQEAGSGVASPELFTRIKNSLFASSNTTVLAQYPIDLHGKPGQYFTIRTGTNELLYIKMYLVEDDVYAVAVVAPNMGDLDKDDEFFLDSLDIASVVPPPVVDDNILDPQNMTIEEARQRAEEGRKSAEELKRQEEAQRHKYNERAVKEFARDGKATDWYDPQRPLHPQE